MNFGRFELRDSLGEGAAGAVHRAFDPQLRREVALKRLHRVDSLKAKRFEREAEVTAALAHPGVLRVHTFGVLDGTPFLVYELVEGARTLDQAFQGASLSERVELIQQAAEAMGYAHAQGVVHRDLKPSNLLVDEQGRLRVADFGVATGQDLERLTVSGVWVGTPLYMAPEQLYCERDKLGPHTDVWALGALLFEALTGQLPHGAESPMELLSAARTPVRPPSSVASGIPPLVEAVCLKALQVEPSERFPSGGAFAAALREASAGRVGDFAPVRPTPLRGLLVGLSVGVALLSALLGLGALSLWLSAADPPLGSASPSRDEPSSPAPSPAASAALGEETGQSEEEASAQLREILEIEDEASRYPSLLAWYEQNLAHPRARTAFRQIDARRWKQPLLTALAHEGSAGPMSGEIFGNDRFLIYHRPDPGHWGTDLKLWSLAVGQPEGLGVSDVCGSSLIPETPAFVLLTRAKGLLVSLDGRTILPPIDLPTWRVNGPVRISAVSLDEGYRVVFCEGDRQEILTLDAQGLLLEPPRSVIGWPNSSACRGALLTPEDKLILFGAERVEGGKMRGLVLRFNAATGALEDTLLRGEDVNAVFTACYNPSRPQQVAIGTRFGRLYCFAGEERRTFFADGQGNLGKGNLGQENLGLEGRAHRAAVRFLGFGPGGATLLSVGSDPALITEVREWRVSDGRELSAGRIDEYVRGGRMRGNRLLLFGRRHALVFPAFAAPR